MSKLNLIQIETAFTRAVMGESVRSIAASLGVTEGALRHHFRKSTSVKVVRRLAFELLRVEQVVARMNETERREVARLAAKQVRSAKVRSEVRSAPAQAGRL